ncbi:uncharacterized protein LOC132280124 [Cornus florida]|uniref:uncharacterized protein LOC132280124 n=1 Tax=Cornus florida TaxID=4283 RepID=UPI002897B966|nr:uncharacterized protein LOC132280124 [Cornus florida]
MASAEQPLKKRKLYEPLPEPPLPLHITPSQPPQTVHQSFVAPPLPQEEIMRRRRNREEIRSLYDCYKRIKFCVSRKDARLMSDLEQVYLSFITASRGCTSVQRIVADLIPRYASFCPTALEAAAKVTINMHNWSLAVINRGEDADGVAFETAKACIFGLADICHTASAEAPTSSVIRGICSAVFLNVLTFFISSLEGEDIFQTVDREILVIQDSAEIFSELKQKLSDENDSAVLKLSKFRSLCLLRIFFCCPKNSLAACFELLNSTATDKEGRYFLCQVTSKLGAGDVAYNLNSTRNEPKPSAGSIETGSEGNEVISEQPISDDNHASENAVLKNCLLGLVIGKNPSLRSWIFLKYKKLHRSASSEVVSEFMSVLEGILGSSTELVKGEDSQVDSDEDEYDPSKYINRRYLVPKISNQQETSSEVSGMECTSRVYNGSGNDDLADKYSGQYLKPHSVVVPLEPNRRSNSSSNHDSGGSRSMDFETGEQGDLSRGRSSTPRELLNNQLLSPVTRKPLDFRTNLFESRNYFGQVDKNQVSNVDLGLPASRSSSRCLNNAYESPKHHLAAANSSSTSQIIWYADGDPAAMEIFSASKQLWLGSLGPEASENLVRFQFEKFGPIEQFLYLPFKGFAVIEYRNIMDAIKAREVMRGHSPWGACLRIKFLDIGLGTRGVVNGVAVGSSCHVYTGNVSSRWAKDDIMHELMKVVYKGPRMVTDLTSEGALLMEFGSPEEAVTVMAHLRQRRKENHNHPPVDVGRHMDAAVSGSASIHVDFRSNNPGTNIIESPHGPMSLESPADSCRKRMSRLSSLLSSLCTKYNINHISGNYNASSREEDRLPTNTLWINVPNVSHPCLTDDELMTVCNLAMGNVGSVVRLIRTNMQMSSSWFVECSSLDAANTLLKNLQGCPGIFFQIEFSQPGKHTATPVTVKPEGSSLELVSPGSNPETHGNTMQNEHSFQSKWNFFGRMEMPEVGARKVDGYDNNIAINPSHGGGPVVSGVTEQMWMYKKPETELHPAPGTVPCIPTPTPGPTIPPPHPFHPSPFIRPVYIPPNSSWDVRGSNHQFPFNPISPGVMRNNFHGSSVTPPFLPASVTPLSQLQGGSMQHFDQMLPLPVVPPPLASLPPQSDMPPPLPSSPPPLPENQPPLVPPPPSSPPPPPPVEFSHSGSSGQCLQHQWQGTLCKSGVHYCTIYAHRVDSDICKYSNAISEPAEWPAKLDMTKRTDFRHVKSTFSSTPPHKREVCWLLPSSASDQKGFQDFVSYLKQRECAGVIKIPAVKSMWARLLFILPHSVDACSMLSISPSPSDCLIALVLPKETNFEWV